MHSITSFTFNILLTLQTIQYIHHSKLLHPILHISNHTSIHLETEHTDKIRSKDDCCNSLAVNNTNTQAYSLIKSKSDYLNNIYSNSMSVEGYTIIKKRKRKWMMMLVCLETASIQVPAQPATAKTRHTNLPTLHSPTKVATTVTIHIQTKPVTTHNTVKKTVN